MQSADHGWRPYKIWVGDMWKCPSCGHLLISGVGQNPLQEHYQEGFDMMREKTEADKINIVDFK
jgi:hypothetical protein